MCYHQGDQLGWVETLPGRVVPAKRLTCSDKTQINIGLHIGTTSNKKLHERNDKLW